MLCVSSRIALLFAFILTGELAGQECKSSEDDVAAKVEKRGGHVQRDSNKTVIAVALQGLSDEDITSVDVHIFSKLCDVSVSAVQMSDRSLVHLERIGNQLDSLVVVGGFISSVSDKGIA